MTWPEHLRWVLADVAPYVLPDPVPGTLAGQEATGQYLSAGDARQAAERILADNQDGWAA